MGLTVQNVDLAEFFDFFNEGSRISYNYSEPKNDEDLNENFVCPPMNNLQFVKHDKRQDLYSYYRNNKVDYDDAASIKLLPLKKDLIESLNRGNRIKLNKSNELEQSYFCQCLSLMNSTSDINDIVYNSKTIMGIVCIKFFYYRILYH